MEYGTQTLGLGYRQRRKTYEITYTVLQSPLKIAYRCAATMSFSGSLAKASQPSMVIHKQS